MEEKINIILIDHYQLFREGVKKILQTESSFHIVASSDHYSVILPLVSSQVVDVILIDVNIFIKFKDNIKREILNKYPQIKVIVLSSEGEENYVTEAVQLGIDGYLLKEMDIFIFIDAIKSVYEGLSYIHPILTDRLIHDYRRRMDLDLFEQVERPAHLYTKREYEVLQLLTEGKSNREIAEVLNISEKTVKNHISSLFKKMKVNARTQAVVLAIKNRWVTI